MKIICDGLDLSDAVLTVSKALPVRSANPVLEGIKLKACGDTLTLLASDMEITIEKKIKAEVLMEGETVVVGKYFVDFVKKLENEQVELSRLYDSQLKIKYSDSESELQVFPVESYPEIEKEENGDFISLKESDFKKIVERTVFACSTDDSRPILKGCLFEVEDGTLSVVALDGFRMSVCRQKVETTGNFKVVVPARTLMEITRILSQDDNELKIFFQKNSLFIKEENTMLYSRLIEGEFVKYNHIIPNNFTNFVVVNRNALLNSIERATIVARNDRFNVVKFDIKEKMMEVSSKSEVGNVNENVNITLTGKDMPIAFNGKYILEYLKIITDDFIKLNLNSTIDPCVFTPVSDSDYIYLVLPVRINA